MSWLTILSSWWTCRQLQGSVLCPFGYSAAFVATRLLCDTPQTHSGAATCPTMTVSITSRQRYHLTICCMLWLTSGNMKKPLITDRRWPVTAVVCNLSCVQSQATVEIWLYSRIVLTGRQLAAWWEGLGFFGHLCVVVWSLLCSQVILDVLFSSQTSTLQPIEFHTAKYTHKMKFDYYLTKFAYSVSGLQSLFVFDCAASFTWTRKLNCSVQLTIILIIH